MFAKIQDLIRFVNGLVSKTDSILKDISEVLGWLKGVIGQIPTVPTVGTSEDEKTLDDLGAWCEDQANQPAPTVSLPPWAVPLIIELVEKAIRKLVK